MDFTVYYPSILISYIFDFKEDKHMKKITYFALFCLLTISSLTATTIPFLPGVGVHYFLNSDYRGNYWLLSRFFETQINNTFCGVASSVMVLNALEIDRTHQAQFGKYNLFTQQTFFTDAVDAVIPKDLVKKQGMTLDELSRALETYDVTAIPYFAEATSISTFREQLTSTLRSRSRFIICNFHRGTLNQKGSGHFSPIAAYNSQEDMVLILDVSRYKLPPFWVKIEDLWLSMSQKISDSQLSRGFVVISSLT